MKLNETMLEVLLVGKLCLVQDEKVDKIWMYFWKRSITDIQPYEWEYVMYAGTGGEVCLCMRSGWESGGWNRDELPNEMGVRTHIKL